MGMGRKKNREKQQDLWMASSEMVTTPGHAFYERLNTVLNTERFDQRGSDLPEVLQGQLGAPVNHAGNVFPDAAVGLF